jgi:c-di-GMP-binding flagellar brake protein YcgR
MTSPVPIERREHERVSIARPCKLYDPRSGKYVPGTTANLSCGGAMIRSDRPLHLAAGDRLYVGIALKRSDSMLRRHDMSDSVVVRSLHTTDGHTALAVRFVDPIEVAAPAARLAA